MALYVLFENKNTFLFLYFICLLFNLQMCQIVLPGPVQPSLQLIHLSFCTVLLIFLGLIFSDGSLT